MAVVCRVILLTNTSVGLANDHGRFVLDLSDPDVECGYSEPREVPDLAKMFGLTDEQQCLSSLTFLFGVSKILKLSEDDLEPESVPLMEVND